MSSSVPRQLDIVDDVMADFLRQKSEGERLSIAHGMWRHARNMIRSVLRSENPGWSDRQIEVETARRLSHGAT
jgi:hypothetical protein